MDQYEVMALSDPKWVVDKVLPQEVLAQFYGASGTYKSFISLDMALCIATGTPWLGKHEVTKSKVVYVAGEGVRGYKKRLDSWLTEKGMSLDDLGDNFRFLPEQLPLNDHRDCKVFLQLLREYVDNEQLGLIVLDTQSRCTEGVDENSNTEMGLIVKELDGFKRKLKTTVMLVHHTGKTGPWDRGASAVKAALDTQFSLERTKNKMVSEFKCTKQKDWEDQWTEQIMMVPVKESLVVATGQEKILNTMYLSWNSLSPTRKKILAHLQNKFFNGTPDGLTYTDWFKGVEDDITKNGFSKALTKYKEMNLVLSEGDHYKPAQGLPQ